jgi:UrcA family protein
VHLQSNNAYGTLAKSQRKRQKGLGSLDSSVQPAVRWLQSKDTAREIWGGSPIRLCAALRNVSIPRNSPDEWKELSDMCALEKLKTVVPCAVVVLLLSPLSAFAAEQGEPAPQRVVRFADLNLDRGKDTAVLYSRIRAAAREVCGPVETLSVKLLEQTYECRHKAIAHAVLEVNSPLLTNYYQTKTSYGLSDSQRR